MKRFMVIIYVILGISAYSEEYDNNAFLAQATQDWVFRDASLLDIVSAMAEVCPIVFILENWETRDKRIVTSVNERDVVDFETGDSGIPHDSILNVLPSKAICITSIDNELLRRADIHLIGASIGILLQDISMRFENLTIEVNKEQNLVYLSDTRLRNDSRWGLNRIIPKKDRKSMTLFDMLNLFEKDYGMTRIVTKPDIQIGLEDWVSPSKFLNIDVTSPEYIWQPGKESEGIIAARSLLISLLLKSWEPGIFFWIRTMDYSVTTYDEFQPNSIGGRWTVTRSKGRPYSQEVE